MKQHKGIIYFILGILFYMIIIPILETLTTLFATSLEIPKGKLSLKITKLNDELSKVGDEPQVTHAIGFRYEPEEDFEKEEDDE